MWISMCKNSAYLVKKQTFIHKDSTLDEIEFTITVNYAAFVRALSNFFHKLIHVVFGLIKGLFGSFTRFPHILLLLLLSIKLNIINNNS
jgi:hypothetical protein